MNQLTKRTALTISCIFVFMLFVNDTSAQADSNMDKDSEIQLYSDKVALLIGNADYKGPNNLITPLNDVANIEIALKQLNFKVTRLDNASLKEINYAVNKFSEDSKNNRVAFFYYAGHTVQLNDKNYLVPVDAKLRMEKNIVRQTIPLDSIIYNIRAHENVISIDACYPNRFKYNKSNANTETCFSPPQKFKGRQFDRFISFISGTNITAEDGKSSLFSTFFSEEIVKDGLPYDSFLIARTYIKATSQGKQDLAAFGDITNCNTGYGTCDNWLNDEVISFYPPPTRFPWPPPKASARDVIPISFFSKCKTLGEVDSVLNNALEKAGYIEKSYFQIGEGENGFAVATRLEQINKDATSLQGTNRWAIKRNERNDVSVGSYLKSLFFPQKGYFRVIVFLVTNNSVRTSNESPSRDMALGWLDDGEFNLPSGMIEKRFTEDFSVTALIYEYELPENNVNATLIPSSIHQGREHLKKSNLWSELNKN